MLKDSWKNKPADKRRIGAATIEFKLDDEDFEIAPAISDTNDTVTDAGENLPDIELELKEADFYEETVAVSGESDYFEADAAEGDELVLESNEPDLYAEFSDGEDIELDGLGINNQAVYDDEYGQELTAEDAEQYSEVYEIDEIGLENPEAAYLEPYNDESAAEELYDDSLTYRANAEDNLVYDVDQSYYEDEDFVAADDADNLEYTDHDAGFVSADDGDGVEYAVADEVFEYADDNDDYYIMPDENILALESLAPQITGSKEPAPAAVTPVEVADYHEDDELEAFDFDSEFDFDFGSEFDLDIDLNTNFDINDNLMADSEHTTSTFKDAFTDETASVADDAYMLLSKPAVPLAKLAANKTDPAAAQAAFAAKNKPIAEEPLPIGMVDDTEEALSADIVLAGLDFAADTPIEIIADEDANEATFADGGEYLDELEEYSMLENVEMIADNAVLEDVEVLAEELVDVEHVEALPVMDITTVDEVMSELQGTEPLPSMDIAISDEVVQKSQHIEALAAMGITVADEAMPEPRDVESLAGMDIYFVDEAAPEAHGAEALSGTNVSIDEISSETLQDSLAEIQRQAEINQKRISEMLSHTTRLAPPSLSLPHSVQNRRQHNRVHASILVSYISSDDDGDSSQGMGVVLDISISGLQLHTPRELVGSHVKLYAIDFNDNIMEITGTIRQSRHDNNVYLNGIAFESAENDTIKFITNLVRISNARKYTKASE